MTLESLLFASVQPSEFAEAPVFRAPMLGSPGFRQVKARVFNVRSFPGVHPAFTPR